MKHVKESRKNEERRYEIFRRLPRTKQAEADSLTGDLDAPRSEKIPGQVKCSRQEKHPGPEMQGSENAVCIHRQGRWRDTV